MILLNSHYSCKHPGRPRAEATCLVQKGFLITPNRCCTVKTSFFGADQLLNCFEFRIQLKSETKSSSTMFRVVQCVGGMYIAL